MRACPWVLISDKWNDKEFNPKSTIYRDLHDQFNSQIDISYSSVENMGALTPDKAKKKFFDLKNPLILILNDYEKSGNGDGSVSEQQRDDANITDEVELELFNANDKRNYLNGKSPAILYLWEKANEFDLLNTVCQQIPESAMLESSGQRNVQNSDGNTNNTRARTGGSGGDADALDLTGLQGTMARTNQEVRTQSVISLLQLISSEEERLYDVEDKVEDAAEGSRKRQRLEQRCDDIRANIRNIRARLEKIDKSDEGGGNRSA